MRLLRSHTNIRGDLGAWLYRVTVNICNDHYRGIKPTVEVPPHASDPAPDPERRLRLKESERLLRKGLDTLTKRERAAVILLYIKGYSSAEVGAMLVVKEATVRSHIHSARTKLSKYVYSVR